MDINLEYSVKNFIEAFVREVEFPRKNKTLSKTVQLFCLHQDLVCK